MAATSLGPGFVADLVDEVLDRGVAADVAELLVSVAPLTVASRDDLSPRCWELCWAALDTIDTGDPFWGNRRSTELRAVLTERPLTDPHRELVWDSFARWAPPPVTLWRFCAQNPPRSTEEWDTVAELAAASGRTVRDGAAESWAASPMVPAAHRRRFAALMTPAWRLRFLLDHPGAVDADVEVAAPASWTQVGAGMAALLSLVSRARPAFAAALCVELRRAWRAEELSAQVVLPAFAALAPWRTAPELFEVLCAGEASELAAAAGPANTYRTRMPRRPWWLDDPELPSPLATAWAIGASDPWTGRGAGGVETGTAVGARAALVQMVEESSVSWPAVFSLLDRFPELREVVVASVLGSSSAESPLGWYGAVAACTPLGLPVPVAFGVFGVEPSDELAVRAQRRVSSRQGRNGGPGRTREQVVAFADALCEVCGDSPAGWRLAFELVESTSTPEEVAVLVRAASL